MRTTRRSVLEAAAALLLASTGLPVEAARPAPRTRLILLGTGGGPRPRRGRAATAHAVVVGDVVYVVDCGDGVARQLVHAGVPLDGLRHVFLTHHHSDHNADYGNLLLLAWASGLRTRVDAWGPPPIAGITQSFLAMSATDIETRIADEGRPPLAPLIHAHEVTRPGFVMRDDNVAVSCAMVEHPLVKWAVAYRFDAADRSIVFSGDTRPSEHLVGLAKGADVLVHEALYPAAIDRLVSSVPNAATLKSHLLASHTAVEDCGRIAAAAGVRTLVLSHLVPAEDATITDDLWIAAARRHFNGEIVVGRDLLEL